MAGGGAGERYLRGHHGAPDLPGGGGAGALHGVQGEGAGPAHGLLLLLPLEHLAPPQWLHPCSRCHPPSPPSQHPPHPPPPPWPSPWPPPPSGTRSWSPSTGPPPPIATGPTSGAAPAHPCHPCPPVPALPTRATPAQVPGERVGEPGHLRAGVCPRGGGGQPPGDGAQRRGGVRGGVTHLPSPHPGGRCRGCRAQCGGDQGGR